MKRSTCLRFPTSRAGEFGGCGPFRDVPVRMNADVIDLPTHRVAWCLFLTLSPQAREEVLQFREGVFPQQSAVDEESVIELAVLTDTEFAVNTARLRIRCRVDNACDSRIHECPSAHDTGLQSYVERGSVESPVSGPSRRLSQCDDFGVCRRILILFPPIASSGNENPALTRDDASDRDITEHRRFICFLQGNAHPLFIDSRRGKWLRRGHCWGTEV
jgi:hypothetical protein